MRRYQLLVTVLILFPVAIGVAMSPQNQIPSVNYCRLQEVPETFGGQVISVRARVDKSLHGLFLSSDGCEGTVFLELGSDVVPKRGASLAKDAEFAKFDQALFDFRPGTMELKNRIEVTVEGRFDTTVQLRNSRRVRVGTGYGPGNVLASRLVLYRVVDVRLSEKE